MWWVDNV
jgi:hypothetical protein